MSCTSARCPGAPASRASRVSRGASRTSARACARCACIRPLARRTVAPACAPGTPAQARRPHDRVGREAEPPGRCSRQGTPLLPGSRARSPRSGKRCRERVGCVDGSPRPRRAQARGAPTHRTEGGRDVPSRHYRPRSTSWNAVTVGARRGRARRGRPPLRRRSTRALAGEDATVVVNRRRLIHWRGGPWPCRVDRCEIDSTWITRSRRTALEGRRAGRTGARPAGRRL